MADPRLVGVRTTGQPLKKDTRASSNETGTSLLAAPTRVVAAL
uniref:Uncharacterized protein n=1 Tax=Picea glauca TaxID=3330 RepID=A0A101M237_PICGL|nr:hypothetical protein ABT39_MTgene2733 [Picea glauca]